MKSSKSRLLSLLALPLLAVSTPLLRAETSAPAQAASPATSEADKAWLAKAKAEYPLSTCVVSGDKLEGGDMGEPIDFVYKEAGKPDRLVRFCCKGCVKTFKKNPEKFLKKIDEAAASKPAAAKS